MADKDYWLTYWRSHANLNRDNDEQVQVLRTFNKQPISPELWEFTLHQIESCLNLQKDNHILDLCAGNGLISRKMANIAAHVTAVDISPDLIDNLNKSKPSNITTLVSDIRDVEFKDSSFDRVLIYAALQYLEYGEAVTLFDKVFRWLKKDGIFFIGDIPDDQKKWNFYNTPEREGVYFKNLEDNEPIIGTWYDLDFLRKLGRYSGFSESKYLPQNERLIYSSFRFDFLLVK